MGKWAVNCGSCGHSWAMAGNWSEYERQAVESRPCPCCGAYTLSSPEPKRVTPQPRRPRTPLTKATRAAG